MQVQVRSPDLARLSRDLKAIEAGDLRKELFRGLNRATKPMRESAKRRGRDTLPARGGLARRVAGARMTTRTRTGGNTGVQIVATDSGGRSMDLSAIDKGRVRHPTFGRRPWVMQPVRPGWWTDAMQDAAPAARQEIEQVADDIARQVAGRKLG